MMIALHKPVREIAKQDRMHRRLDCLPQTIFGMTRNVRTVVCQDKKYYGGSCTRSAMCDSNNCENGQCKDATCSTQCSICLNKQACDGSVGGCKWNAHKQNCGQCLGDADCESGQYCSKYNQWDFKCKIKIEVGMVCQDSESDTQCKDGGKY